MRPSVATMTPGECGRAPGPALAVDQRAGAQAGGDRRARDRLDVLRFIHDGLGVIGHLGLDREGGLRIRDQEIRHRGKAIARLRLLRAARPRTRVVMGNAVRLQQLGERPLEQGVAFGLRVRVLHLPPHATDVALVEQGGVRNPARARGDAAPAVDRVALVEVGMEVVGEGVGDTQDAPVHDRDHGRGDVRDQSLAGAGEAEWVHFPLEVPQGLPARAPVPADHPEDRRQLLPGQAEDHAQRHERRRFLPQQPDKRLGIGAGEALGGDDESLVQQARTRLRCRALPRAG